MHDRGYTPDEMMTVATARLVRDRAVCFVGIGLPSAAANLARQTHAPNAVLIYESGTIDAKPRILPSSIGDGELSETATTVVSIAEIFWYWLQGGRIDIGLLGAAQIDRFANINTSVIGDYSSPKVRLPGAGGAPEIALFAGEVLITLQHDRRAFREKLDFVTSIGHLDGGASRDRLGVPGRGPAAVVTDLGILVPDPATRELTLSSVHAGVELHAVIAATEWPLKIVPNLETTAPPTPAELGVLRDLKERTERAHYGTPA